jgi:DNA-binding NarL/FixJ family response regulator
MRRPLQVYVVEDAPILQRLLASAIEAAGAQLSGCSGDAQTAIADVFASEPDLILIDIRLASGSGFDVLRALQEQSLAPRAIKAVLTNYADREYQNLCARLGADRFFDKSLETSRAVAFIHALAAERRAMNNEVERSADQPSNLEAARSQVSSLDATTPARGTIVEPAGDGERSTEQAGATPGQEWTEQRKARASEILLPRTMRWIATLPDDFQLTATAKAFPRIANELAVLCSEQQELTDYLDELLVDRRGRRQGFPLRVLSELHALRAYCSTFVVARETPSNRRSPGGLAA